MNNAPSGPGGGNHHRTHPGKVPKMPQGLDHRSVFKPRSGSIFGSKNDRGNPGGSLSSTKPTFKVP